MRHWWSGLTMVQQVLILIPVVIVVGWLAYNLGPLVGFTAATN